MKKTIRIDRLFLQWFIVLAVPLALLMTAVRLMLTPVFIQLEYRLPGFPEDQFGFSMEGRLHWAPVALDYLLNDQGIEFLGNLRLDDGTPLYNQRELSHMEDVKALVQSGQKVWIGLLVVMLGLGIWSRQAGWWDEYRRDLGRGGRLTIILILIMILSVFINFDQLFTGFHHIFFEGDTWLFYSSDTLIRLFPMRFWRDAFILIGLLTSVGGITLWYCFEVRSRR
jgi:integral membrane protein (TIGR01906 family)